jgi:predicted metal-dependent hydrolase
MNITPEEYAVTVDSEGVTYRVPVEYERKKRRGLVLRVYPRTGRVVFSLPLKTPESYARAFFAAHTAWLTAKLRQIIPRLPPRHNYLSGEKFYYLGRPLILTFADGGRTRAEIAGDKLFLFSPRALEKDAIRALLSKFFAALLPPLLNNALAKAWRIYAPLLDLKEKPSLKVRRMSSKWAVCRPLRGEITFSSRLAHVPPELLDYVMAHEICHLACCDHSPRFWRLVEQGLPDYRDRRRTLNELTAFTDI